MENLVEHLKLRKLIKTKEVEQVFLSTDRGDYCKQKEDGYLDHPSPVGFGVTISAPHMQALSVELMAEKILQSDKEYERKWLISNWKLIKIILIGHLKQNGNVFETIPYEIVLRILHKCISPRQILDVGCGTGYTATLFAKLSSPKTKVIGLEILPEVHTMGENCIRKSNGYLLDSGKLELVKGNAYVPLNKGLFDCIHVGAAAESLENVRVLLDQLKVGGTMVLPFGTARQGFYCVEKLNDKINSKKDFWMYSLED